MDDPKFIVSNQKEESISMQRVKSKIFFIEKFYYLEFLEERHESHNPCLQV